jgi:DNA repair photolyase
MVIYEPKGKAKEYCELATNLYAGCSHGCTYCYAPSATYKTREAFSKVRARDLIIEHITKEAPKYSGREILLCFTCDPYQHLETELNITRQAIDALHQNNCIVNILTKGGSRSIKDFDLLSRNPHLSKYGATLTFTIDEDSLKFEPFAAVPEDRFIALRKAHELGIRTWASLEPVIIPKQTLQIIEHTKDFVDLYKVGKWNYDKAAKQIDWKDFRNEVISLLESYNKEYYIKEDLKNAA